MVPQVPSLLPLPPAVAWRSELRATFHLAWPLALMQLAQMSISLTEVALVGHLGAIEVAGAGLGSQVFHASKLGNEWQSTLVSRATRARGPASVGVMVSRRRWEPNPSLLLARFLTLRPSRLLLVVCERRVCVGGHGRNVRESKSGS
jgi:hypothetical protein